MNWKQEEHQSKAWKNVKSLKGAIAKMDRGERFWTLTRQVYVHGMMAARNGFLANPELREENQ